MVKKFIWCASRLGCAFAARNHVDPCRSAEIVMELQMVEERENVRSALHVRVS